METLRVLKFRDVDVVWRSDHRAAELLLMYNFQPLSKVVTTIIPAANETTFAGSISPCHSGTVAMSNVNPYQTSQSQPSAPVTAYSTRMMQIKKIEPMSAGKLLGTMYALIGLLFGGFVSIFALVGAAAGGTSEAAIGGIIGGLGAIVFMPLFYGVAGFVGGAVGAFIYNIVAAMVGGISLEIEV